MTQPRPKATRSYLEMTKAPQARDPELEVISCSPMPAWYFLALYKEIGKNNYWTDWLDASESALENYCNDLDKTLYTLLDNGAPAGFFILHQIGSTTDLAYFGLMASTIGKGFGSKLLDYAIATAWAKKTCHKVTVNTCTLDHPRALPLYLSKGFEIVKTDIMPETRSK